jgi:hypothetical protein
VKTARTVTGVAFLVVIVSAGVGVVLSDGVQAATPPTLTLIAACLGLFAVIRQPPRPPKPWDRKRIVLTLAVTVPTVAILLVLVLLPMTQHPEDGTIRATALLITAMVLAALALIVGIARNEHRAARSSNRGDDTE